MPKNEIDLTAKVNTTQSEADVDRLTAKVRELVREIGNLNSMKQTPATNMAIGAMQGQLASTIASSMGTSNATSLQSVISGGATFGGMQIAAGGGSFLGGGGGAVPIAGSGVSPMHPGTGQAPLAASGFPGGYTPINPTKAPDYSLYLSPNSPLQPAPRVPPLPGGPQGVPTATGSMLMGGTSGLGLAAPGSSVLGQQDMAQRVSDAARPFGQFGPGPISRYGVQATAALAYAGSQAATSYFDYQAQRIMQGGVNYQAQYSGTFGIGGSLVGAGIGAAIGTALFPGAGTFAGAAIGATTFGGAAAAFGNFIGAGPQSRADANVSLMGFFGARYGLTGLDEARKLTRDVVGYNTNFQAPSSMPGRLQRIANTVNERFGGGELQTSLTQVAATFGTVAGNLFNFGVDPFGTGETTGFRYQPFADEARRRHEQGMDALRSGLPGGGVNALVRGLNLTAQSDILGSRGANGTTSEGLAETYTRRLGLLFGKESPEAAKRIAPGFDPFLGGNTADILGKLGATDTLAYLRIHNKDLSSDVTPELLSSVAGGTGRNARAVALGGLQALGSGYAKQAGFAAEMLNIARLPEGQDSLAYAQAYSGYRGARSEAFQQQTMSGFGLRDLQLQGEQKRQEYMPFAPGNIFATSLGIISNNRRQIGAIQGQLNLPDLSEQERYSLTAQQQGLMTENARNVGMLSEGFENRLPALAAGRPAFFNRYNSAMGAAINLGRIGSPVRAYGAGNGSQAAMQDQFVRGLGGDFHGATSPMSRTLDLNTTNNILERILGALLKNNGGASAPGRDRTPDRRGPDSVDPQQRAVWNSR